MPGSSEGLESEGDFLRLFFKSVTLATTSAVWAVLIAFPIAYFGVLVSYALARKSIRFKSGISAVILLPLVVPTVVFGVALLVLFRPNNPVIPIPLGLWAVLIGHIVLALPFCVLLLLPRIASIDRRLEEAAHDLGASGFTTFRRIVLPLITPALLAALIVAFVISIDEVVVASFVVAEQPTYPVFLYSGLRLGGQTSLLMPVATVMLLASFLLVLAAELIRRVGERRLGLAQDTQHEPPLKWCSVGRHRRGRASAYTGSPPLSASERSRAARSYGVRAPSGEYQAACGLRIVRGHESAGSSGAGGSAGRTSSAAPPR